MKTKKYTKFSFWVALFSFGVALFSLMVAVYAVDPTKSKRILCKAAVFFEIFESQRACEVGCQPPEKNKNSNPKPNRNKPSNQKKRACGAGKKLKTASSFNAKNFLVFGIGHLTLFFIFKSIGYVLRLFTDNQAGIK